MAPPVAKQIAKELHKTVKRKFERRPVLVKKIDDTWAIDLVDMVPPQEDKNKEYDYVKKADKGCRYILTVIDVLSKYAWGVPLKSKTPEATLGAIQKIIQTSGRTPDKIWADRGGEFKGVFAKFFNKELQESRAVCPYHETCGSVSELSIPTLTKHFKSGKHEFSDEQIEKLKKERFTLTLEDIDKGDHFVSHKKIYHNNPIAPFHVSVIERFNRTLKTMMFYKFTKQGNQTYVEKLPKWIEKYNNTWHSSTGLTPEKASLAKNEKYLLKIQQKYKIDRKKFREPVYELGDRVRTVILKGRFEKGYTQSWSKDIFKIVEINYTKPISYRVENEETGKFINGSYYAEQLQLTKTPKTEVV